MQVVETPIASRRPNPECCRADLDGLPSSTILWRVRRAGLFLKLANAPAGSWRHLTFIAHHHLNSAWFSAAQSDLNVVLPGVRLIPTFVTTEPYLSSSGKWSEVGEWVSYHAYILPTNMSGCRYGVSSKHQKSVRAHVKYVTSQLQTHLTRQSWSSLYTDTVDTALAGVRVIKIGIARTAAAAARPAPAHHV